MIRTATYTAKLSRPSHTKLDEFLDMLRVLYNAALEERIDAYRKSGKSIGYVAQAKSLTEIRNSDLGVCAAETSGHDLAFVIGGQL